MEHTYAAGHIEHTYAAEGIWNIHAAGHMEHTCSRAYGTYMQQGIWNIHMQQRAYGTYICSRGHMEHTYAAEGIWNIHMQQRAYGACTKRMWWMQASTLASSEVACRQVHGCGLPAVLALASLIAFLGGTTKLQSHFRHHG